MKRGTIAAVITALFGIVLYAILRPRIDLPPWLEGAGPFTLGALVTFVLMPPLNALAHRLDLVDRPDERKHHRGAIPLVGGIAIYIGFLVVNFSYGYHRVSLPILGIMLALGPLVLVGVLDDMFDLPAWPKLLVQLGSAVIIILFGTRITFMPPVWWGDVLEWIITVLWLIGLTNAMNFLDGIDGLAACLTITAAMAFGVVALQTTQPYLLMLCAALGGACTGFLPFNFRRRPAAAFLGDAGATMLGFALAAIAITGEWGGPYALNINIAVPILILGVPIFDTTFISITRFADGHIRTFREWLEYTGRDHIHHRLLKLGLNRFDTVLFICIITVVLSLSAITLNYSSEMPAILSLIQGAVILVVIGRFMLFMERRDASGEEVADGSTQ